MKAAVLLLTLTGLCSGLQPGLEYQYRYSGRVGSGITDVRQQYAAAGIQADVTVQVAEDNSGMVQFSNVEVGDFHGDFDCNTRAPIPIEYHHLQQELIALQKPFRIIINETQVIDYMEVASEPLWITNIRKAIINIFRILPFGVRRDPTENIPNFSVREETIVGRCTNWYNVAKLTQVEAARVNYEREQLMEIDSQRYDAASGSLTSKGAKGSKTAAKGAAKGHGKGVAKGKGTKTSPGQVPARLTSGVSHIDDTLWNVVRATAFEDCDSYFVMKGHLTRQSEQLLTRTSVGTYLIRGGVSDMRIESAVIEGSITVFTQDDQKEHYDTITNQTIELKVVRPIQEELQIAERLIRFDSWQFETQETDLNRVGKDTFEAILTGKTLTPELVTEVKRIINTGIQDLSDRMPRNPTYTKSLVEDMNHIVDAVSVLTYSQIQEIYTQYVREYTEATSLNADNGSVDFQEKKIFIFKQSLIAAGTEPAITFLLDKMKSQEFRYEDDETVSNFFNQIPSTIKSPSYIPKILEAVMQMTWDDREQDDKSVALITVSQLVNKMCLHAWRRSTHWDNTCESEHVCKTDVIINVFIPYLYQQLEDDESPMWQRLIYLQSLSSLGTPHTIELLKPYILGVKETHLAFRKNAIWSLSRSNMHVTARVKVFQILMPIFWNKAEHHEVRSIAFLVMATWSDSISWWQEMAAATWHEPSNKVANFISTTIRTAALMEGGGELPKTARKVQHLTKPAAPASITHSMNYYLLEYVYTNELGHPFIFAWLSNTDSIIPSEIYIRLRVASFLGFTHETKLSLQQFGFHNILVKIFDVILAYQKKPDRDAVSIVTEMFQEIQENIGFNPENTEVDKELYLKLQRVFKFIMTIPDDVIQRLDYTAILVHRPRFVNVPHYNRYIDAYAAIPTDLGLPFFIKHTAQNAWWLSTTLTLSQSTTPYGTKGSTSITLDVSKMISVEAKVLVPWSEKSAIGTGSQRLISLLFPFKVNHFLDIRNSELQLTFEPITNEKVHIIDASNTPFTVQYGSFPTIIHYQSEERKIIKKLDVCLYDRKTQVFPSFLGLWAESQWTGDVKFPLTFRRFYSGEVSFFTPTLKYWDYHVLYDPEASGTKSVTITLTYVSTDKTTGFSEDPADLTWGQETQGSDYSQLSQFSQSASSDYQDFNEIDAITQEQSPIRQRIARLQEQVVPATGGHVRSVSVTFSLQGKTNLEYEGVLTWATGKSSTKRTTKFQVTWIKAVPKGVIAQPHATCFSGQMTKPYITPLLSVDEMVNTDLHATFKAEIHDGASCDDPALLEIEGTMDVSQERMDEAREKLTSDKCGPENDFLPIDLITSPVYDHLNLKAQWTDDFPVVLKNFSHYAEDWIRGVAFPNIYYDYTVTNDDQIIEIDATKCPKTNKWTLHVSEPNENFILDEWETPYIFDVIASPAAPSTTLYYDMLAGREHTVCILDQQKIRTLDGLVIPFKPDACWTVMVIDATGKGYGSLEVRYVDGEWEARVLFPKEGLMLELTKTQLKVNGEDHRTDDDRFHVTFLDDGALLTFPYVTTATLKITDNNIIFVEEQFFRSMIGGVCGNFDGEKTTEMIGPKGCVYTDPDLFVKSWATPAPGCTGFTYQAKKRPVDAYQDVCPHLTNIPTGIANPTTLKECSDWEYQERTEGNLNCKALIPTPICKPGCRPSFIKSDPIMYDCQVSVPDGECNLRRYITSYPGDCIPQ